VAFGFLKFFFTLFKFPEDFVNRKTLLLFVVYSRLIPATRSQPHILYVRDWLAIFTDVTILVVSVIGDDLEATVGQLHLVLAYTGVGSVYRVLTS
jgi:hypothetical protein